MTAIPGNRLVQAPDVTNAFISLAVMCYLSYFLYRKGIFFRV